MQRRSLVSGVRWRALYLCLSQRGEGNKKTEKARTHLVLGEADELAGDGVGAC